MAPVEEIEYAGRRQARTFLTCPECNAEVEFPFEVDLRLIGYDNALSIQAEIVNGGKISDQPLFDHKLEEHGPDAEG